MITATPSAQISVVDSSVVPSSVGAVTPGGLGIVCPNGFMVQEAVLPPGTSDLALAFPVGVTTALVVYILPLTATDLKVNVGPSPFPLPVPMGQPALHYGLTSAQISLSSALGGRIQYAIGG